MKKLLQWIHVSWTWKWSLVTFRSVVTLCVIMTSFSDLRSFEETLTNFLATKCSTGKTFQANTKFFYWYARCRTSPDALLQNQSILCCEHVTNEAVAAWLKLTSIDPLETDDVTFDFDNIVANAKDCGIVFVLLLDCGLLANFGPVTQLSRGDLWLLVIYSSQSCLWTWFYVAAGDISTDCDTV